MSLKRHTYTKGNINSGTDEHQDIVTVARFTKSLCTHGFE